MHSLRVILGSGLVSALILAAPPVSADTIVVSGNAPVDSADQFITYMGSATCCTDFPAFTPADFAAAASGPFATVIGRAAGNWIAGLTCDEQANWIGFKLGATVQSALFAHPFNVTSECIGSATLTFCWAVDDVLGGSVNSGVLNGNPVAVSGGNFIAEFNAGPLDVADLVQPGANTLYVYCRDTAAFTSGVIFSAVLEIGGCDTPSRSVTWSAIRSRH